MLHQANTDLEESAAYYMEEWAGTLMGKLLQQDIDTGDYESLAAHVSEARMMSFERDYKAPKEPTGFNLSDNDAF